MVEQILVPTYPDPGGSFTRKCQSKASDGRMRWVVCSQHLLQCLNLKEEKEMSAFPLME